MFLSQKHPFENINKNGQGFGRSNKSQISMRMSSSPRKTDLRMGISLDQNGYQI